MKTATVPQASNSMVLCLRPSMLGLGLDRVSEDEDDGDDEDEDDNDNEEWEAGRPGRGEET